MTEYREMEAVVEAVLFVANEPVPRQKLLEVFGEDEREEADQALAAVLERYRENPERGFMIDEVAGGLRLVSRPDLHGYLRRFFEVSGTNRLTMAALEALAIIAYRQPVTGPEIHELRGANSSGVIKKLLERRLIRIAGRKEVVGKPFIYTTTREFLMHFGLRSLKELPPLEQFEELFGGELDGEGEKASAPDIEEEIDQQVAALEEQEEEAARVAEAEEVERERAAADEAMELEEIATTAKVLGLADGLAELTGEASEEDVPEEDVPEEDVPEEDVLDKDASEDAQSTLEEEISEEENMPGTETVAEEENMPGTETAGTETAGTGTETAGTETTGTETAHDDSDTEIGT